MGFDSISAFKDINPANNVDQFKQSVDKGMTNYKSDAVKAINPIANNLKQGVAYVKSTESKVTGMITGYKSEVVQGLNNIVGKLSGGLLNLKDTAKYLKVGKNGVSFDTQAMQRAVGNYIGLDISSNAALMNQLTRTANTEFNNLSGGYFGNMVTSSNGSFRISKNWRDQMGNGLLSALGRTTGVSIDLVDKTVSTSYNNALLYSAAQYGMSDAYSGIASAYLDQTDAKAGLINAVQYMLDNGDVVSIQAVLKLIDPNQHAVVNAKYPHLISSVMSNFSLDPGVTSDKYTSIKAMILQVFSDVAGDSWYLRNTAFGMALDLSKFNTVSSDIKKIMLSDATFPDVIPLLCATGIFSDSNAKSVMQQYFPNVPILIQS